MDLKPGLDSTKNLVPPGFDLRTTHSVANHYTDWLQNVRKDKGKVRHRRDHEGPEEE